MVNRRRIASWALVVGVSGLVLASFSLLRGFQARDEPIEASSRTTPPSSPNMVTLKPELLASAGIEVVPIVRGEFRLHRDFPAVVQPNENKAAMIYIWNELIIKRPDNFNTGYLLVYDFPLTVVFTVLVHMIYTGMYFHQYYSHTIEGLHTRVRELEASVAGVKSSSDLIKASGYRDLLIVNGTSSVPVQTNDIAFIYKQNEISFIKTFDGKEYTSSSTLENLEELLDPVSFFRLNRQMIGNIKAIKQFKSDATGKLILEMQPSFSEEVNISKKKAVEFKAWIGRKI